MSRLSADEQAARMAEQLLRKSGEGEMPTKRGGKAGAEGGFTEEAGGQPIDTDIEKSAKTGAAMTGEPGRMGPSPKAGTAITDEPDRDGDGGAEYDTAGADGAMRSRKAGQIGGQGGSAPDTEPGDEDQKMRGRKAGKVGMSKALDEDDEDDDEEEMEESCKKSIDPGDLIKSLEMLEELAQGSQIAAPEDRRAELARGLAEGVLSKAEMAELSDLMKASLGEEEDLSKSDEVEALEESFQKAWAEDDELSEGYEVSGFLERHSQLTAEALDTLSKSLQYQQDRAQVFNVQLAKSLRGMAQLATRQEELIKSLSSRLEQVENAPLPRRGVTRSTQVLNKSMRGEVGAGVDVLDRETILNTLEDMAMRQEYSPSGHQLVRAVALYEQEGTLAKSLYSDVVNHRQSARIN